MVTELLKWLMREERALHLAEHPTKANGYYTRTPSPLRVPWRISRSPVSATRSFILASSPTDGVRPWSFRQPSWPSMPWSEYPSHLPIFRRDYGAFSSPQNISRLTQVVERRSRSGRNAPWARSTTPFS